jgi:dTDP-glucose pyrophosphorylase
VITVVMPMAGLGTRFAQHGYAASKPLLDVDGEPMFARAMSSLDALPDKRLVFVVREEQVTTEAITATIRAHFSDSTVVTIPSMTRGAAETALCAGELISPGQPLIVLDCDLYFQSTSYERLALDMTEANASAVDAALLVFPASHPRYSYVSVDDKGQAREIVEKRVISDKAVAGAYLFARGETFLRSARRVVDGVAEVEHAEMYMSSVVSDVIRDGGVVTTAPVDIYRSFGTPEELAAEGRD